MRQIRNLIGGLIIGAIAFGFFGYAPSDSDTPIALIKKIIKEVTQREDESSDWELAETGERLFDGQEVKTGHKSMALILFTDGSGLLRVRENSIANIYGEQKGKTINKNTFVQEGSVGFDVKKQEEDEEFKFTTPTVVASIRGTAGLVQVEKLSEGLQGEEASFRTTVIVEKGNVEVQSLVGDKQTLNVNSGESAVVDPTGNINIQNISTSQLNDLKKSKIDETKKIRIKTKDGVLEIEYLVEEE